MPDPRREVAIAPGAKLVGVGSGATLLVLNALAGFEYSLANQYLVMERGEIVKRGAGADMDKDGVRQLLAV